MFEKISRLKESFKEQLEKAQSAGEVEELRVSFLGKNGSVTGLLKSMGGLSPEDRKTVGQAVNELKETVTKALADKLEDLRRAELEREIEALPEFDVAVPLNPESGSFHPITLVQRQCETIFRLQRDRDRLRVL